MHDLQLPQPNADAPDDLTVILANGTFPTADYPTAILRHAAHLVCCDGAAVPCLHAGLTPTVVIGDGDSLPPELRQQLAERFHHVAEQDTNDLNKAFRLCQQNHWHNIVILGATGKREDHTLGNLSLLADFAQLNPAISIVTDDGIFLPLLHPASIRCHPQQQVSIFALEPNTPIHSSGLRWPLDGLAPSRWWHATLNEATDSTVSLRFPDNRPLLVFLAFSH